MFRIDWRSRACVCRTIRWASRRRRVHVLRDIAGD